MGKIISNGIEYGGLINIEGAFIDTNNIIDSGTYTSTFSYTANEDCYMFALLVATPQGSSSAAIDGEDVGNVYSATSGAIQKDVLVPLKKGQVFTINNSEPWNCSYSVYGIQSGSHTKGLPDYSTTEQKTGQKWINGKDIYQTTIHLESGDFTIGGRTNGISNGLSNVETIITKDAIGIHSNGSGTAYFSNYFSTSDSYICQIFDIGATEFSIYVGSGFSSMTDIYVTFQYTKSTT